MISFLKNISTYMGVEDMSIESYFKENQAMDKCLFKANRLYRFSSKQTSFKTEIIYSVMGFFLCIMVLFEVVV